MRSSNDVPIHAIWLAQDDPKKNTAVRLSCLESQISSLQQLAHCSSAFVPPWPFSNHWFPDPTQNADHEPDKDGTILPLAYGVKRLDFKFLDGTDFEWEEEWDTTGVEHPNKLPRAVRIVLVLEGPSAADPEETEDFTYATTVMLEFSGAVKRSALASGQTGAAVGGNLSQGRTTAIGAAGGLPGGSR